MSADNAAVLAASIASAAVTVALVGVVVVLVRRVRDLRRAVDELRGEAVPLVRDARVIADQAATELVRVGDVLDSAEAVSTTVDSASRLAYRVFSNPVVKVLAYGTGMGSALRRLVGRGSSRSSRRGSNGHAPGHAGRPLAHAPSPGALSAGPPSSGAGRGRRVGRRRTAGTTGRHAEVSR